MNCMRLLGTVFTICLTVGCSSTAIQQSAESLTAKACSQLNGTLVLDPGDGSTHRDDYRCGDGSVPLGSVDFGIEGAVCCSQGTSERPHLTPEQCGELGGTLIGDPGDGTTRRPDFRCSDGSPSLGNVVFEDEGGACCPE